MSEYRLIPLGGKHGVGKFAKVSPEDHEYLLRFNWIVLPDEGRLYVARSAIVEGSWTTIRMHREIMQAKPGELVDHENNDGLDNRRGNLRVCSNQQNSFNARHGRGASRFKGVSFRKSQNKWRARIRFNNKLFSLGDFDNETDAALAYDAAAVKYFGEFASLNFPAEQS